MRHLTQIYVLLICFSYGAHAQAEKIFVLGNSLSWDTNPANLDGKVDFHIFCGKNLSYIFNNPEGHCVETSLPWTFALSTNEYDWISFQPHVGTTLYEDVEHINTWLSMQPNANVIVHSGWAPFNSFPSIYEAGNPDNSMRPSPEYISALIMEINRVYPDRIIRSSHTNDILYRIWEDIENNIGPLDSFSELFRDSIHMDFNTGRYLAHNAMRLALGQELNSDGFEINDRIREYIDRHILHQNELISDIEASNEIESSSMIELEQSALPTNSEETLNTDAALDEEPTTPPSENPISKSGNVHWLVIFVLLSRLFIDIKKIEIPRTNI